MTGIESVDLTSAIAFAFAIVKAIEKAFDHAMAKFAQRKNGGNGTNGHSHCKLDDQARSVLLRTDDSGAPLVYGARVMEQQRAMAATLVQVEQNTRRIADVIEERRKV